MSLYALYIVSKSGGLIFHKNLSPDTPASKLSQNDQMVLGSTFAGLHAIATQVSPCFGACGINKIVTDKFVLKCFSTLTNMKFFIIASPAAINRLEPLLRKTYSLYTDFVLKNPFYEIDQPIPHGEKFDIEVSRITQSLDD